jgi:hypothetical protein
VFFFYASYNVTGSQGSLTVDVAGDSTRLVVDERLVVQQDRPSSTG